MKTVEKYKIAVIVLCMLLFLQWVYFSQRMKPTVAPVGPVKAAGKIAIVIDDWGYNLEAFQYLKELAFPVTVSVLPNLRFSGQIAQDARSLGCEVLLHLPMEPYEKFRLEKNTLTPSMSQEEIQDIITDDLQSVGPVKGANNHMGSKTTEDYAAMERILQVLKKNNLFFLDSLVTRKSAGAKAASKLKLPFVQRDVFLDNKDDRDYITQQLYTLKRKASAYGSAVGIGHDRSLTLRVLKAVVPEFQKQGYEIVFVSELAQ